MEKVKKGVYYNMKSKYCILMVLAVILINCILYGCSEKNQNISELPDGISIKKSTIKGKENDEILVIKKLNNENYKNVQGYIKTNSDFTEISIVFKNTNNESNDIELEYLPKIEWPKHDIIWNLYLYDGRSLEQFSKLDDIYYMKINSAAEVNLTSLDNVRYLEIHNADITEKSNIGDMKKLISVTFQNCTVDGIGECSKLENLAQIVIYDGKCMSLSGLETCNNDICLDIPYVKINQNAINDLQNVNISSMIIDSDFEGNLSQLKNISMIDVFGENISQQLISNISEIDLFRDGSHFTDDTVLTLAVADWLLHDLNDYEDDDYFKDKLVKRMVDYVCRKYKNQSLGYGFSFWQWCNKAYLIDEYEPYNSFGNGSAMRVSPVGWFFDTMEETMRFAKLSADITHNHPEGEKGAMCIAAAIFLARNGKSKDEIKEYIIREFGYSGLDFSVEVLREKSNYSVTCQDTVPLAVAAFLESTDFESAIKLAISYGSDSDTIAAMAGSIAEAYYKEIPLYIANFCKCKLDKHAACLCKEFFDFVNKQSLKKTY